MPGSLTMTVHLSDDLKDFVLAHVGEDGPYKGVEDYVQHLIRSDKERSDDEAFARLKAELTQAFAASESSYQPLTAEEVIARNQS